MNSVLAWMATAPAWLAAGTYALGIGSAVIPWLNAEILLLSVLPLAPTPSVVWILVATITFGQMTGKCLLYAVAGRAGWRARPGRMTAAVERWRTRLERCPGSAAALVFGSAVFGMPPFYVVSIVAGAAGMALSRFLLAGTLGRLLHFGAVAWLPDVIRRLI